MSYPHLKIETMDKQVNKRIKGINSFIRSYPFYSNGYKYILKPLNRGIDFTYGFCMYARLCNVQIIRIN